MKVIYGNIELGIMRHNHSSVVLRKTSSYKVYKVNPAEDLG